MRWLMIPVSPNDVERGTELSRDWLQQCGDTVSAFFERQSGGRGPFSCETLDWRQLDMTRQQWANAGATVGRTVYNGLSQAGVINTGDHDHYVLIIDDQISTLGVTPNEAPETSLIAAQSFSASLLAHELAHRLGAGHTFLSTPSGSQEYGGLFCLMGFENAKHSHTDPALINQAVGATAFNAQSGPGLCFPNLVATGWADAQAHALQIDASTNGELSSVIDLPALAGAPPPGVNARPACIVTIGDRFVLEYRSPSVPDDAGMPGTSPVNQGDLVVYQSPPTGSLLPVQVAAAAVFPGLVLPLVDGSLRQKLADATGGSVGIPLQVTVLRVDPNLRKVSLRIEAKPFKVPQFERTDDIFDFLRWAIAGREVPGEDQLNIVPLVRQLAELQHLDQQRRLAGPRDAESLKAVIAQRLDQVKKTARLVGG